jgi:hypothetical protein
MLACSVPKRAKSNHAGSPSAALVNRSAAAMTANILCSALGTVAARSLMASGRVRSVLPSSNEAYQFGKYMTVLHPTGSGRDRSASVKQKDRPKAAFPRIKLKETL